MTDILLIYVTCESVAQAKKIGRYLLEKRLCACVNIFPHTEPLSLWPPRSGKIEEGKETVLLIKTLESKYKEVETEVLKLHSYEVPCILAIPIAHVSEKYREWLKGELV